LATGSTLTLLASSALAQGTGDAAQNWGKIAACAGIDSSDQRLACVDAVYRAAGLLDPAREVAQQRQSFGQPPRERRKAVPPPTERSPAPRVAAAAPSAPLDQIVTTVSQAFDPGNHLMVIVTQDSQIWQQNESKDLGLPPRAGTRFTIEKGALGSFNCRIATGRTFRCRRHA
jgi:hypothetical protein